MLLKLIKVSLKPYRALIKGSIAPYFVTFLCVIFLYCTPTLATAGTSKLSSLLQRCINVFIQSGKNLANLNTQWKILDNQTWDDINKNLVEEIVHFRSLKKNQRKQYLMEQSHVVENHIEQKVGHRRIGFHYNLHGGTRVSYVEQGGIHAQMGDSGVAGGFSKDFSKKVYFFNLEQTSLFEILNSTDPQVLVPAMRMGSVLTLFNLNHPLLDLAKDKKVILSEEAIFLHFSDTQQSGFFYGVPREAYLLRPLEVFQGLAKKLSLRSLSWDEQTLVQMRFIEREFETMPALI